VIGNLLSSFWPSVVNSDSKDIRTKYETSAVEIDFASGEMVWFMGVSGSSGLQHETVSRAMGEAPIGWAMYSIERFYSSPLIIELTYHSHRHTVAFTTFNSYRQQFYSTAQAVVTCGAAAEFDSFAFNPHWQRTEAEVTVPVENFHGNECELSVTNAEGTTRTVTFSIA